MRGSGKLGLLMSGIGAGIVNGLFGAGGGMVLVPLLTLLTDIKEEEVFPTSVSIILPICVVSLLFSRDGASTDFLRLVPYLAGSAAGGILCGILGRRIPTKWLHRLLGVLILWGGVRYLC